MASGRLASGSVGPVRPRRKAEELLERPPQISGQRVRRDNREADGREGLDGGNEGKEWKQE